MSPLTVKKQLQTVVITVSVVGLGLLHPGSGTAGVTKVDVCHRNGTGAFQLLNVAAPAIQAHRAHGDALPGEAVPGSPGLIFDDACQEVTASSCPCHLTPAGLASLNIDFVASNAGCFQSTHIFTLGGATVQGDSSSAAIAICAPTACNVEINAQSIENVGSLTGTQLADCIQDLGITVETLALTCGTQTPPIPCEPLPKE